MSSHTSRPSGSRLEDPAGTSGGPGGTAVRPHRQANPSWLKVIGTTLRLWVRRRVLRVPDSERIGKRYSGRIAAVVAVVVVIAGGAAALAVTVHSHALGSPRHVSARAKLTPAQAAAQAAAAAAAQANGKAAARWIATQATQGLVIGCDPATCAAILASGYPTGGQVVLEPGVRLPGPGSLIVATAAVRAQYGAQLGNLAPAVIAGFGTGAQAVQVKVVVPGGLQGYSQIESSALAARRHAGQKLLRDRAVHARGAIRTDIGTGLVDPRLITALRRLATHYGVDIVHLGDAGPQIATTPFRMAEVTVLSGRTGPRARSELGGMEKLLKKEPGGHRAELRQKRLAGGTAVLEIEFLAPSPF